MAVPLSYSEVDPKFRANKFFTYILASLNVLSPLFIFLNSVSGVLGFDEKLPFSFSAILACLVLPSSIIQYLLVYKFEKQNFARYFGVISILLILGCIQIYTKVEMGLFFSLICFVSCLYFSVRFSICVILLAYLVALFSSTWSLFFKFYLDAEVDLENLIIRNFIYVAFEFFLIFVVVLAVSIIVSLERRISEIKTGALKNARLSISSFSLRVMESHDGITNIHSIHTSKYCKLICNGLVDAGYYRDILNDESIELYSEAAIQHDIGKIHISAELLGKKESLSEEEKKLLKTHTIEGRKILEGLPKIKTGEFNDVVTQMAFYHHEMYNGDGYPLGISGKSIPLCARIVCIAESLDHLLSWQLGKQVMSVDEVMDYLEKEKGHKFDPEIIDVVLTLKDKIIELEKTFKAEELEKNAMAQF